MSFKDRPFHERFHSLGNEAEAIFEASYAQGFVRYGLDRPPIHMASLPPFVRFTPDYLTARGAVEVQGFGRDQNAKFRREKLAALGQWHHLIRVDFFIWDSHNKRYGWVRLPDLERRLRMSQLRRFPEGNEYFEVPADELPVLGWTPHGDGLSADR